MKKHICKALLTALVLAFAQTALAQQSLEQKLDTAMAAGDTLQVRLTLEAWQDEHPEDADLYEHWFHYYLLKARGTEIGEGKIVPRTFDELTTEQLKDLREAFDLVMAGTEALPNQLNLQADLMFWLINAKQYGVMVNIGKSIINLSKKNNNQWKGLKQADLKQDDMLALIAEYIKNLSRLGENTHALALCEYALAAYPNDERLKQMQAGLKLL